LDRNDLAQTTTNENPIIPMEVIHDDNEGSVDANINLTMKKTILLIKMIVTIIDYCFISFYKTNYIISYLYLFF